MQCSHRVEEYEKALQVLSNLPLRLIQTKGVQSLFYAVCRNLQNQKIVERWLSCAPLTHSLIPKMEQSPTSDTLQATAEFFFEMHQYDLAADRLRSLLTSSLDPEQRLTVVAQYVIATSHFSLEEASRFAEELPEVPVIQDMDMNELEDMLKRRDFLKRAGPTEAVAEAAAALSHPTTPQAEMEVEEAHPTGVLENVRKLVGARERAEA